MWVSQLPESIGGMTRRMHLPLTVAAVLGIAGVPALAWVRDAILLTPVLVVVALFLIRAGLHRLGLGDRMVDMRRRPSLGQRRPRRLLHPSEEGGLIVVALLVWRHYHQRHAARGGI